MRGKASGGGKEPLNGLAAKARGTDIYRHARRHRAEQHPLRPKHMETHIQSSGDNSLHAAWTWQPNISVRVKNKKGEGMSHSCEMLGDLCAVSPLKSQQLR